MHSQNNFFRINIWGIESEFKYLGITNLMPSRLNAKFIFVCCVCRGEALDKDWQSAYGKIVVVLQIM